MSKELFFVLSIPMIINLQVHIPLWKKKIHVQHDIHIPISLEADYSGHLVENKTNLLPSTITAETCEQLVERHFQLKYFHSRLR